jgi:WD40 repeat protein
MRPPHAIASGTARRRSLPRDTADRAAHQCDQPITVASPPRGKGLDVAFSADGSRLASSHDGTVRVWDPSTGEQLLVLRGHYTSASSVAFSPDGSRLASVGAEGVVRVWALELDELVDIAEREVTRALTDEECRQFLHQQRCE